MAVFRQLDREQPKFLIARDPTGIRKRPSLNGG
jgi:hypothetical protein